MYLTNWFVVFMNNDVTCIVNGIEDLEVVRPEGLRHAVERGLRGARDVPRIRGTLVGAVERLCNLWGGSDSLLFSTL